MVFADQAADDLSALDPGSDIDDVAGAKTICVVIGDNLPEKRKAGGSTPPLTTPKTCINAISPAETRVGSRAVIWSG